jgi:hypothetical protein
MIVPAEVLGPRTLHCSTGAIEANIGDKFRYRSLDWEIAGFSRETFGYSTHEGENPSVRCRFSGDRAPSGLDRYVVLGNCIDFCGDSIAAILLSAKDEKPRDARGFVLRPTSHPNQTDTGGTLSSQQRAGGDK